MLGVMKKVLYLAPLIVIAVINPADIIFVINFRGCYVFCSPNHDCFCLASIMWLSLAFLVKTVIYAVPLYTVLTAAFVLGLYVREKISRASSGNL